MSNSLRSGAGGQTNLAVCANLPATYDQLGYEALTWVDVNCVSSIPKFKPDWASGEKLCIQDGANIPYKTVKQTLEVSLEIVDDVNHPSRAIFTSAYAVQSGDASKVAIRRTDSIGNVEYVVLTIVTAARGDLTDNDTIFMATGQTNPDTFVEVDVV